VEILFVGHGQLFLHQVSCRPQHSKELTADTRRNRKGAAVRALAIVR
jgi:hypothetical protein